MSIYKFFTNFDDETYIIFTGNVDKLSTKIMSLKSLYNRIETSERNSIVLLFAFNLKNVYLLCI